MGNFGKLFVVAKREYMERIRSRWFVVMTLLVPALFSGAMLFPVYVAARSSASGSALRNIAILDASGTGLGEQIATTLKTDSTLGRVRRESSSRRRPIFRPKSGSYRRRSSSRTT
jgi:ABC-type Na+ efflux pump permease subunit